jgi:hypothetical protein
VLALPLKTIGLGLGLELLGSGLGLALGLVGSGLGLGLGLAGPGLGIGLAGSGLGLGLGLRFLALLTSLLMPRYFTDYTCHISADRVYIYNGFKILGGTKRARKASDFLLF